jgi:uncharacterized NAD(P)/FAD-binding protein YdhS
MDVLQAGPVADFLVNIDALNIVRSCHGSDSATATATAQRTAEAGALTQDEPADGQLQQAAAMASPQDLEVLRRAMEPHTYDVAVVGAGPLGLQVAAKLHAYLSTYPIPGVKAPVRVNVHLVDPGPAGPGVHTVEQSNCLLLNTAAGYITMFGQDGRNNLTGPPMVQWANDKGYRVLDEKVVGPGAQEGRPIADTDFLPRCMLGEYLSDVYGILEQQLVSGSMMVITHHDTEAVNFERQSDGRLRVDLQGKEGPVVHYGVLTTGQPRTGLSDDDVALLERVAECRARNPLMQFIPQPYPTARLHEIPSEAVVAIRGLALTAHDVVAELTEGRGGRFERDDKQELVYVPSGNEPRMVLFSRQGFPPDARAVDQKGLKPYQPFFFTREAIDALRAQPHKARLDFHIDVLPILRKELCYAYHRCVHGEKSTPPDEYVPCRGDQSIIDQLFRSQEEKSYGDYAGFLREVFGHLDQDVADAKAGNATHPMKAAADALRDMRDMLRYVVDFDGLNRTSYRRFLEFARQINQIIGEPPTQRNEQMLALLKCTVTLPDGSTAPLLTFGPGPNPTIEPDWESGHFVLESARLHAPASVRCDVLVHAHLGGFDLRGEDSTLYANLRSAGLLRPHFQEENMPGGIDVTPALEVVDAKGERVPNLAACGLVTEGPKYVSYLLPGPGPGTRTDADAAQIAANIVEHLHREHTSGVRQEALEPPSVGPRWTDADAHFVFIPGQRAPSALNDVPMRHWKAPADPTVWGDIAADDIALDAAYPFKFGETGPPTAAMLLVEFSAAGEPSVWLHAPTDTSAGEYTLPTRSAEPEESLPVAARRAVYDALALQGEVRGVLGDYGNRFNPTPAAHLGVGCTYLRAYWGVRTGGNPSMAGAHTRASVLVSLAEAERLLQLPRDKEIIRKLSSQLAPPPQAIYAEPRDQKRLVLHGMDLTAEGLRDVHRLAQPQGVIQHLGAGMRHRYGQVLPDVRDSLQLRALLERLRRQHRIDFALVPTIPIEKVGMVVSNMHRTPFTAGIEDLLDLFRLHGSRLAYASVGHSDITGLVRVEDSVVDAPQRDATAKAEWLREIIDETGVPQTRVPLVLAGRPSDAQTFQAANELDGWGIAFGNVPELEQHARVIRRHTGVDTVSDLFVRRHTARIVPLQRTAAG